MEEGQHVDQAAEGRVRAARQRLRRNLKVRGSHVQLQPVRGLRHHLKCTALICAVIFKSKQLYRFHIYIPIEQCVMESLIKYVC